MDAIVLWYDIVLHESRKKNHQMDGWDEACRDRKMSLME